MDTRFGFGSPGYDIAHLLGGGILLLSFLLLFQRRLPALIGTYAGQAWLLAAAAAWQGWVQGDAEMYVTSAITLAAKGVLIPLALRRIARHLQLEHRMEPALGVFAAMACGIGVVTLSILTVLPITQAVSPIAQAASPIARENLAFALSVVLLGLLTMVTRRRADTQVIGLLSLENGLILAAIGVAGMPLMVELATAVLVLVAGAVFGFFFLRLRRQFASLDTAHLDRVGGGHR